MPAPAPNPWILEINAYVPGRTEQSGVETVAKLSSNESNVGASPAAIAAARDAVAMPHRYPQSDSADLRRAIGEVHGLDPDRIVCGTGSDEILTLIGRAYAKPGDAVVYSRNTFAMYEIIAHAIGAEAVEVPDRDLTADVDGILATVTPRTRIVYLANPNNPTGTYLPAREIERLAAGLGDTVILVLDAAYAECVDAPDYEPGVALCDARENVVMTRTFSKLYGLAGLRVGWGYLPRAMADAVNRVRNPFNVSAPGLAAAAAAVSDDEHLALARAHTLHWRNWLAAEARALGLEPVPSQTNFVLLRFPDTEAKSAAACDRYLAERGYFVRRFADEDLRDYLRISVGTEAENRGVIALIGAFLDGASA